MKSGLPALEQTTKAPSLMLETYPDHNLYSKLHDERVEDHFKVKWKNKRK